MKLGSKTSGLGDILLLTALCRALPNQLTIQLPPEQKRFECLFQGLAKVEICPKEQIICAQDFGDGHYARKKLRVFFGPDADNMDIRPLVIYTNPDDEQWAADYLRDKPNPVIVCPFVAKQWSQVRDLPFDIIQEILGLAKNRQETPIFIQDSDQEWQYPTLRNLDLRKLICLMRQCGKYYGANTGLYHLAVAVGAQITCFQPEDGPLFQSSEWCYKHPTIKHYTWAAN